MKIFAALLIFVSIRTAAQEVREADCVVVLESSPSIAPAMPNEEGLRQAFIEEYAEMIFADEAQNQAWIDDALKSLSIGDIHALIENSWMKKLNDKIIKNKDLVTALTNFHKKLFLEEFRKRRVPLKLEPYQDFKSTRLTLPATFDSKLLSELEAAFVAANSRFYSDPTLKAILRAEDMRDSWFRMGIGQSETQAALAARDARDNGGANNVSYYWDSKVKDRFTAKLESFKEMHKKILKALANTSLLVKERGWTGPHVDVFAAARKATPENFLQTLRDIFPGQTIDQSTAELILKYSELADEFSPSILVAKRELLTIHDAPFGAFSIDFLGLGAENLRGTVKALVKAKDLNDAVRLTRKHEREITEIFNFRKGLVRAAAYEYFQGQVSMRFSGDDGIIIPGREVTLRDQLHLVQKLAALLPKPYFRMALINAEGAAGNESSQLITHGESIEKELREVLRRKLGGPREREISLEVYITDTGKFRKVFLIMSGKKKLNEEEKKSVRNSFPLAVKTIEEQVRKQGLNIEYDPTEIFAIFGAKPY